MGVRHGVERGIRNCIRRGNPSAAGTASRRGPAAASGCTFPPSWRRWAWRRSSITRRTTGYGPGSRLDRPAAPKPRPSQDASDDALSDVQEPEMAVLRGPRVDHRDLAFDDPRGFVDVAAQDRLGPVLLHGAGDGAASHVARPGNDVEVAVRRRMTREDRPWLHDRFEAPPNLVLSDLERCAERRRVRAPEAYDRLATDPRLLHVEIYTESVEGVNECGRVEVPGDHERHHRHSQKKAGGTPRR